MSKNYIVLSLLENQPHTKSRGSNEIMVKKAVKSFEYYNVPYAFLSDKISDIDQPLQRLFIWVENHMTYYEYVIITNFQLIMWTAEINEIKTDGSNVYVLDKNDVLKFMIIKTRVLYSYLLQASRLTDRFVGINNFDVFNDLQINLVDVQNLKFLEFVPQENKKEKNLYYHCHNKLTANLPFCSLTKLEYMVYKKAIVGVLIILLFVILVTKFKYTQVGK